jgi:rfaE bifunctional protein nucleotidyltransferase chain/domain
MRSDIEKTLLNKILDLKSLKSMVTGWQADGKKVVFTNGVFDLLHLGHITYMAKASELGDKLIIGLNSDSSVKRIKGDDRPVNDQNNRAALLAALFFVDAVTVFEEIPHLT